MQLQKVHNLMLVSLMLKWMSCKFIFYILYHGCCSSYLHIQLFLLLNLLDHIMHALWFVQILIIFWQIDCCRLSTDGQEFFTSYDEVYESFDSMGLYENLLRGIYAYGRNRTNRTEKIKSKVITTGGSYGAAEGRRKQTKGRSKNKEWMNVQ